MKKGFTLIELLVVIAILGILATVGLTSFRTSQMRGRDAQRKSDLKQISNAFELYYQDYSVYPKEMPVAGEEFTDGKTVYMKIFPNDPNGTEYVYQVSLTWDKYQVFAALENLQDKNINPDITMACGVVNCNYAVTSSNTTATEEIVLP